MNHVRAWFRRWLCSWHGHPRTVAGGRFIMGATGGIRETERWSECQCGKVATDHTVTRIRAPYTEVPR